jgi:hypothetical protein
MNSFQTTVKDILCITGFLLVLSIPIKGQDPIRIGIAGLSHPHAIPLLRNLDRNDIQVVGIAEG